MKVELSTVYVFLGILAIIGGFLIWVLGLFLTDKKDKLTLVFEIDRLKEKIKELQTDTGKIELIQRDLDIIKEQIKHL